MVCVCAFECLLEIEGEKDEKEEGRCVCACVCVKREREREIEYKYVRELCYKFSVKRAAHTKTEP